MAYRRMEKDRSARRIVFVFYLLRWLQPYVNVGHANCLSPGMKIIMPRFLNAALLGAALLTPMAIAPTALRAEDHKARVYHDKQRNDDHEWNGHEDQAYRVYAKENHRKYRDFSRLNDNDQQAYWGWRHEHSDALLKIDVR
jgi:hypothetical protein